MTDSKFSVVIPTMWRYAPFVEFLKDLVNFDVVDEIIIFDNDASRTPADPVLTHPKIKVFDYGTNIFVNPAWNTGVRISKNKKICILNDDVIFDLKLFYKIDPLLTPDEGVFGLCPGHPEHGQPEFVDGTIDIRPWNGEHTLGFGCLMFIHKYSWIEIPDELKVYYGDNWIFDANLAKGKVNYIITNILHYTPYAQTTGEVVNDFLDKETPIYHQHINDFRRKLQVDQYLLEEYKRFCFTPSNINEHLPTINRYTKKCSHVTELGVSEGCSTRAFLVEDVVLRSYDIVKNSTVQSLFEYATNIGKDVKYTIADVNTIELEETDLLFIDTWHAYDQLKNELAMHSGKVRKYIIMHDTQTFGTQDEDGVGKKGLLPAIMEFLISNRDWQLLEHYKNNNGLTVLGRI